jgi:hypothetical protein
MRANRFLPALALCLFLPARADDGPAAKAPAQTDVKKSQEQMSCCAGEEKVKCPRAKAAASSKKPATKTAPAAAAAKPAATAPLASGAGNMVVTRDPETGELRNATAKEREKLLGSRPPQASVAAPRVVILPDGTEMVELGEENMSYAVVRRNPDGTLTKTCVEGPEAASAARKPKAATPAPRAEER